MVRRQAFDHVGRLTDDGRVHSWTTHAPRTCVEIINLCGIPSLVTALLSIIISHTYMHTCILYVCADYVSSFRGYLFYFIFCAVHFCKFRFNYTVSMHETATPVSSFNVFLTSFAFYMRCIVGNRRP